MTKMGNSYFENNDDDNDSESDIELLEYTDETNKYVRPTGKIKNQYIFEDTAKVFGTITDNEIVVDFNEEMKIRSNRGAVIETPLIKDIDHAHKYKISIPVNSKLVDNEQDVFSYFLMRPLAQLFGKSDVRNLAILLADNSRLNQAEQAATEIWKTTEAHRIESFYNKLRLGTYADIQRLNKKSFDNRKIDNIIDAVKAVHAKREELIPKKYADLVQPVKTLLQRVERSDPAATNIITKRIFDIVEQELTKEQQKLDEARKKREQREKEHREKYSQETPSEQQLPTEEELQAEAEAEQEDQNGEPTQAEAQAEQEQAQEDQNNLNQLLNQNQSLQDRINERLRKAAIKSIKKDVKDQNFNRIDIDTETIRSSQQFADSTSDQRLDKLLDKSKEKGENMIDQLNEKLTKVDQQDKKPEKAYTNFATIDKELEATKEDEIAVSRPQKNYDVVLSRQLRHMFENMRTKFRNIRSDSSGAMNIKRTIQYIAGDREAKIYDRNIRQTGINIRFLVDCSGSMEAPVNDRYDTGDYYNRKSKDGGIKGTFDHNARSN